MKSSYVYCDFEGPHICKIKGTLKIHRFGYTFKDFEGPCTFIGTLKVYRSSYIWYDIEGPYFCTFMGTLKIHIL